MASPTAEDYRKAHLPHRVGVMRALLPHLDRVLATKSAAPLRQSTFCAMKEGALITMRSLLFTLGARHTKDTDLSLGPPKRRDDDCPTNPLRPGGPIFKCAHLKESDFSATFPQRKLLVDILNAGSRAAAHLVSDKTKIDHNIDEHRLKEAILFVSDLVRTRIYDVNVGWDWNDFLEAERQDHAVGQY